MEGTLLQCDFCYRMCRIAPGRRGFCGVREQGDNELRTVGYGRVISASVDPVEKKPFYHVFPGKSTLSAALFGCNFRCAFCQNSEISQPESPYASRVQEDGLIPYVSPERLNSLMLEKGLDLMCYTYSDPVVWQDYLLDTARLVKASGGYNLMVTNGSFSKSSLERVLPLVDGFNIDVKGDQPFYREYCSGSLTPVLDAVERISADSSSVVEVTTLIIEGIHTEAMIRTLGKQLHAAGVQVWHLSRFFPHYRMADRPPTSEACLERMLGIAEESGIPFIYAGNSGNRTYERTVCPSCGTVLIRSHSYAGEAASDVKRTMPDGRCSQCGQEIYGFFT